MTSLPLTLAQRRLWLERLVDPSRAEDRLTMTRVLQRVDFEPLAAALANVAQRHDALRVTLDPHEPRQILGEPRLQWTVEGERLTLIAPEECCDAWSLERLHEEIAAELFGRAGQDARLLRAECPHADSSSELRVWPAPTRIVPELDGDDDAVGVERRPVGRFAEQDYLQAFRDLLSVYTRSDDVSIGMWVETSPHGVGCFTTVVPLTTIESARRLAAVPFERLLQTLLPGREARQHPLFEITFATGAAAVPTRARFDLELTAGETVQLVYRSGRWPAAWAHTFLEQYEHLLHGGRIASHALATVSDDVRGLVADSGSLHVTPSEARRRIGRTLAPERRADECVVFAGEPLTGALVQQWRRFFPGNGRIISLYQDAIAYEVPSDPRSGVLPIGQPLEPGTVRLLARDGRDCGAGEIGELHVRGRATGDLARVRSDGMLEIVRAARGAPLETAAAFTPPRDPVELRLARLWEELLEVDRVGIHDDFFELGGDSLLAVHMLARVRQDLGRSLDATSLLPDATIERLARVIGSGRDEDGPLVTIQGGTTPRALFCVHPSGGSILCYVDLARLLGKEQRVFGLKGPDPRSDVPPPNDAAVMAARYVSAVRAAQPHGPFVLAGYSFGGLIAFEMARLLAGECARLVLLDTRYPRVYAPADRNPVVDLGEVLERHDLDRDSVGEDEEHALWSDLMDVAARHLHGTRRRGYAAVQEFCRTYRLLPVAGDLGYADLRRFLRNLRANFRTMRGWVPAPCDVPVTLLAATEMIDGRSSDYARNEELWRAVAPRLQVRHVNASHFSLLAPPAVEGVAATVRELLDDA